MRWGLRAIIRDLGLGLIFKDAPDTMEIISIPGTGTKTNKWTTKTVDLSAYANKEIASINLVMNPKQGAVADYQMNIGEIRLTDGQNHIPAKPTGFKIDRVFTNDELIVNWDLGDFEEVDNYEIYAQLSNGETLYCGGIFGDIFYIKSLLEEKDVATLELYAVGKDGRKSEPAVVDFNFKDKVSNVAVAEETKTVITRPDAVVKGSIKQAEELSVISATWENPTEDYKELELTVTMDDSKDKATKVVKTVAKGENSADIIVPRAHGEKYNLAIKTVYSNGTKSEAINVTGNLKDAYVEPYNSEYVKIDGTEAIFFCPDEKDWLRIHVTANGQPVTFRYAFSSGAPTPTVAIRATTRMVGQLPSNSGMLKVVLEDYAGNFSEPTYIPYYSDPDLEITADLIPDATLLEAVKTQVGTTIKAVTEFEGTLDLSNKTISDFTGIELLASAKTINLTNTGLTVLDKGKIATNAETLILKNNAKLTKINFGALSMMPNLKELDITGCPNLKIMNVNDSSLEKLTYGNVSSFSKLISLNMSNAKFDMSQGTAERVLAEAVKVQAQGKDDIIETSTEKKNIALNKTIDEATTTVSASLGNQLFDGSMDYLTLPKLYPTYVGVTFDDAQEIVEWTFHNDSYTGYGLEDFEIQYSTDGTTWNTLGTPVVGSSARLETQSIANPVAAKYYRLMYTKAQRSGPDVREWELYAYEKVTYSAGAKFDGQKPEVKATYPNEIQVKKGQGSVAVKDILTAITVRGTNAKELVGKDFIAEDYDVLSGIIGNDVLVTVTDKNGNVTKDVVDISSNGTYTVKLTSFNVPDASGKTLTTLKVVVGAGGVTPPVDPPKPPVKPPISGGGGTGGGNATPDVDVSDKGDTTEVTVTTPDVYVSGDRVEVLVPDIDVSNATSEKPVEVKIDVPTNSLVNAIKDAQGSLVSIDVVLPRELVNAANVLVREINIKEEVFTQARESGKDIVVNIKSEDGAMVATWTFKANGITRAKDTNLSVMLKNSSALNSTAKFGDKAAVVNFRHNGTLPSTASVKLNVKSYFKVGDKLTLYYDDTATGQLLKMGKEVVVDSDGNATISIAHCSNYVLVKADVSVDTPSTSNPQTGDSWFSRLF